MKQTKKFADSPAGLTCYHRNNKPCAASGPHPLTGHRCCTAHGNTQLDDVFKCPACLEASGHDPEVQKRW